MFVDLSAGIYACYVDDHRGAIYRKQNPPASYARLSDSGALGERGRKSRIERVVRKLGEPCPQAVLGVAINPIEYFFSFTRQADMILHNPRSRS